MARRHTDAAHKMLVRCVATAALVAGCAVSATAVAVPIAAASAVCGSETVAYAYEGACASYGTYAGWYGSYGPGFATTDGWVLAATDAGAAAAPDPSQAYSQGSPPTGMATGADASLGFAFSEAQATDAWTGGASYSAADEATAAELLYDEVAWGTAAPVTSGGVLAAYDALDGWYVQSLGATGSPHIDMNTTSVGPIPTAGAIYQIRLTFPGTGTAASGYAVTLAVSGGYVTGGGTSAVVATDADGYASEEIYADSSSSSVSVSATATVGSPALDFYDSTAGGAPVVSFAQPVVASNSDVVAESSGTGGTGTISVDEGGDDTAYVGLAGGVYQVLDSQGTVVATLTTASDGAAGPTQGLPLGTYTVHEETAPAGYTPSADQSVTVVDGGNVTAHFTGAAENHAIPATLVISDTDQQTGVALAGARYEVYFDAFNDGSWSTEVGSCITGSGGLCAPTSDDGAAFLPGKYQAVEVVAPPGYYLTPESPTQTIDLAPAGAGTLSFEDRILGSLSLSKTGDDTAYYSVAGAAFSVAGPLPSGGSAGVLTVGPSGTSNVVSGLQPGAYTVTETAPPPGYSPAAPFSVTVALGHAVTQVSVEDAVDPGTLDIYDQVAGSAAPVVGGVFDVRYDALDDGTYSVDLGQCTTDDIGACSPAASSGLGLLPGRYEVTEVSAPPGYGLDTADPTRQTVLVPGAVDILDVHDPRLVPLSFAKVPTGNFDPASADLAGARFEVRGEVPSGPVLASCTTDGSGECTTGAVLLPGTRYCWTEVVAPAGFEAGETGCVVATATTPETPVLVDEPGDDVEVRAVKVASGNPADLLAGALLDLYRMGAGPAGPTAPAGTPTLAGGTWVASATSTASGPAAFPLQLPGYAYCVLEATPPAGYLPAPSATCTPVLVGSPVVPAAGATVTIADQPIAPARVVTPVPTGAPPPVVSGGPAPVPAPQAPPPAAPVPLPAPAGAPPSPYAPAPYAPAPGVVPPVVAATPARVTVRAHKYDALEPGQSIPGVLYDLYVVGTSPPFAPATRPNDPAPASLPGRTWVARARTSQDGDLAFDVPAGYAWCLKEVAAPPDYVLDPRAHCTTVLTKASPLGASLVVLPEQPLMVDVQAHKYNSLQPGTSIAGATYDVYSEAERAPGAELGADASGPVPAHVEGAFFYRREVTGRDGLLVVAVPAGYAWCLKELRPPPAYRFDTGLHCTTTLSAASPVEAVRLALPELPRRLPPTAPPAPQLPFTGIDIAPLLGAGSGLAGVGLLLCFGARTRSQRTRRPGTKSREARRGGTRGRAGRRSRREPCGASRPGGCGPTRPPPTASLSRSASSAARTSGLPAWGRRAGVAPSPSIRIPFSSR